MVVLNACKPGTRGVEGGGSHTQGQPGLNSKTASKNNTNNNNNKNNNKKIRKNSLRLGMKYENA